MGDPDGRIRLEDKLKEVMRLGKRNPTDGLSKTHGTVDLNQFLKRSEPQRKPGLLEPLEVHNDPSNLDIAYAGKKKLGSSRVAAHSVAKRDSAVGSKSMQPILPTGGAAYAPSGCTGMAVASALVTLGNPRKPSVEPKQCLDDPKSDRRKGRKATSHNTSVDI